ncbi:MAG TPA: hypothetical protein VK599_19545 [Streptosporangiaceae bacterium]|nr:hypothetical protein [Streptosporangiaceae bacterium]
MAYLKHIWAGGLSAMPGHLADRISPAIDCARYYLALAVRLRGWLSCADGGQAKVGVAGEPLDVGALVAEEGQGEVESLDLAVPSLGGGFVPAGEQIGLDLAEAGKHPGVDVQEGQRMQACSCWQGAP